MYDLALIAEWLCIPFSYPSIIDLGGPFLPGFEVGGLTGAWEVGGGSGLFLPSFSHAWGPEETTGCLHSLLGIHWGRSSLIAKQPHIGSRNLHLEGLPR